ncbi:heptaprenyl diphosphate synthase component II [compost metagenome]
MKLGAIVGGASTKNADLLYQFGENLGLAFQLQDDILDVYANPEKFGKQVGGDIIANKKTFLLLKAISLANKEDLILLHSQNNDPISKVKQVTDLYNKYKIKALATAEMNRYLNMANEALAKLQVDEGKKIHFRNLVQQILEREH